MELEELRAQIREILAAPELTMNPGGGSGWERSGMRSGVSSLPPSWGSFLGQTIRKKVPGTGCGRRAGMPRAFGISFCVI